MFTTIPPCSSLLFFYVLFLYAVALRLVTGFRYYLPPPSLSSYSSSSSSSFFFLAWIARVAAGALYRILLAALGLVLIRLVPCAGSGVRSRWAPPAPTSLARHEPSPANGLILAGQVEAAARYNHAGVALRRPGAAHRHQRAEMRGIPVGQWCRHGLVLFAHLVVGKCK